MVSVAAVEQNCTKCGERIGAFRYWTKDGQFHPRCAPASSDTLGEAEARRQDRARIAELERQRDASDETIRRITQHGEDAQARLSLRVEELEAEVARLEQHNHALKVLKDAAEKGHRENYALAVKARRAALEEAARVCDGSAAPENTRWVLQRAAAAIRALAEQEPQG